MRRFRPTPILLGLLLGGTPLGNVPDGAPPVGSPLAGTTALAAQEVPPAVAPIVRDRGWLGLRLVHEAGLPVARVEAVLRGGPAERAGLRRGDEILGIDDAPVSGPVLVRLSSGLEPGSETRLRVRRDGTERTVSLRAVNRPLLLGHGEAAVTLDSITARVRVRFDSLGQSFQTVPAPRTVIAARPREGREITVVEPSRRAWVEGTRPLTFDGGVRVIEPLALTGGRAVAGAELTPLNEGLARYFGTDSGVLAIAVVDGTPADEAGLRAGDVITAVENEPVRRVDEVRAAIERGYRSPPVRVRIVREGEELVLEFSR